MAHLAGPNSKHTKGAKRAFFSMYSILPQLGSNLTQLRKLLAESLIKIRA